MAGAGEGAAEVLVGQAVRGAEHAIRGPFVVVDQRAGKPKAVHGVAHRPLPLGEVEEEQRAGRGGPDLDGGLVLEGGAVSPGEALAVDGGRAGDEVEPRPAARREGMPRRLARLE